MPDHTSHFVQPSQGKQGCMQTLAVDQYEQRTPIVFKVTPLQCHALLHPYIEQDAQS